MAGPGSTAQDVITCDLCDNPTQQYCNNCQVNLCVDCVSKHVDILKSSTHDIVPFMKRKIQLVFPECTSHPHQRCEGHCQQCDVPVCFKCLTGPHNKHDVTDMADIVAMTKEEIKKDTEEIADILIPKYGQDDEDSDKKIAKCRTKFVKMEEDAEKTRTLWHQVVDDIFNKIQSTLKSKKESCESALKIHQSKMKKALPSLNETLKQKKYILKSNKVLEITKYKSKLVEYREIFTDSDVLLPEWESITVPGVKLSVQLEEHKATLTQTSISNTREDTSSPSMKFLHKARVIADLPTGIKPLYSVACDGKDEAWLCSNDPTIRRVDKHKTIKDVVKTICIECPGDITMSLKGELIYSDFDNKTVNIVRNGKSEILISAPQDWLPLGLCCTRSGDILVNMATKNRDQHKTVRYQGQWVKQEIIDDEYGIPIYKGGSSPLFLAENNNGDICASDCNATVVVVVSKTGKVRFRYNGDSAKRRNSFGPVQIVTDLSSQIIMSDVFNDCLHILDQNGYFLRCIDDCGLVAPGGLSLDTEGRIWVGLESGNVKVIQYLK
ncbi:uncharacterized protein LOC133178929 [Saccostrea echinata]|uniref:uncharacterized protein LOC133178929 n=1 Tax=Saccostrea echinata TaxID=191078 RepID=UPI002A82E286|nr:uncharacterized protein LOC133178929 [Saccostrea echinata]